MENKMQQSESALSADLETKTSDEMKELKAQMISGDHPLIYADQMSAFAFGPFVSKIIFAAESFPSNSKKLVATIVMPTNVLHQIARDLNAYLSQEGYQDGMRQAFEQYQASVRPTKSPDEKEKPL